MGLYKVEVDKPEGVFVVNCGCNLDTAKAIANQYNSYGYDVYIKETRTIYMRRQVITNEQD